MALGELVKIWGDWMVSGFLRIDFKYFHHGTTRGFGLNPAFPPVGVMGYQG
jgi:hypothetical protein